MRGGGLWRRRTSLSVAFVGFLTHFPDSGWDYYYLDDNYVKLHFWKRMKRWGRRMFCFPFPPLLCARESQGRGHLVAPPAKTNFPAQFLHLLGNISIWFYFFFFALSFFFIPFNFLLIFLNIFFPLIIIFYIFFISWVFNQILVQSISPILPPPPPPLHLDSTHFHFVTKILIWP